MLFATFSQIFFWVFAATNIVFGLLFFWKAFAAYRAAATGKTAVVIKIVICLAIWILATLAVVVSGAGYFAGHSIEPDDRRTVELESATVYLISLFVGWILIGAAILFWMNRAAKR